jgi:ComF family protein
MTRLAPVYRRVGQVVGNVTHHALHTLVGVVSPPCCAACDSPTRPGAIFCNDCGPPPRCPHELPPFTLAGGRYAPPLSTAIRRMKFGSRSDLAARLLPLLVQALGAADSLASAEPADELALPVPLHSSRLIERGFNPAALLAKGLARHCNLRFGARVLVRSRATLAQSRLSRAERSHNVQGAFAIRTGVRGGAPLAGRSVVLVDDVITTGATVDACRRVLYAAGCVRVRVVALAAASSPEHSPLPTVPGRAGLL